MCGRGDEMAKDVPDPLKPANIPGQDPATPELCPADDRPDEPTKKEKPGEVTGTTDRPDGSAH